MKNTCKFILLFATTTCLYGCGKQEELTSTSRTELEAYFDANPDVKAAMEAAEGESEDP